jgi:acyl-CoA synthetase (AMP-forming)/AMP-acid ligase II
MPKGVLWRQHDIYMSVMGGAVAGGAPHESLESVVEAAKQGMMRVMPAAPFMHGAGHWIAFLAMNGGNTVVIQDEVRRLDPKDVLSIIEREKISFLQIVGDSFARPILDEMESGSYDLSSMFIILSGGAPLNSTLKERFLAQLPNAMILDGMGSSEGGGQMTQVSTAGSEVSTGTFTPAPGTCIVSEDFTHLLEPGSEEVGWVAKKGNVPLGYLGDPEKSARTFPVIDGVRYSIPGDRGRQHADGIVEMLGRDSVTINSGGEKIFAEEVEAALGHHPAVYDAVVCGRASEQWGQEVVAIVQLREGLAGDDTMERELLDECAKHIARYKLPKAFVFVDTVLRSPAGKADYRWAKEIAASAPA